MKLLTKELRAKLPKLYQTEKIPCEEKTAVVKFFQPWGSWTWYATEFDGDDLFFGLVHGFEKEWGYFSLRELELESVSGPFGLRIERDLYFKPTKIKDIGS